MGLLDKVRTKGKEDEPTPADIKAADDSQDPAPPDVVPAAPVVDTEESAVPAGEASVLDQALADIAQEPEAGDALADADDPAPEPDMNDGDELMDIFSDEIEEDVDISALTEDLEELDVESLVIEAKAIAARLREALGGE